MSVNFEKEYCDSMGKLQFSTREKDRLYKTLVQAGTSTESEGLFMRKTRFPKAAVIAASCIMIMGATVFAATKIAYLSGSSSSEYDYKTVSEMNASDNDYPDYPETLGNGFKFDGGNIVKTEGMDESGNTVESWDELEGTYKNSDGKKVHFSVTSRLHAADDDERTPTAVKEIDGTDVAYNYDEYLFVPVDYEPDNAEKERMEEDAHFFISYGSDEPETKYFSSVYFEQGEIAYTLYTFDDVSQDTLFEMVGDLLSE